MGPPANQHPSSSPPPQFEQQGQEQKPVVLADDQRVALRLTVTRGALGLELYEPVEIGPIEVSELSLTLPNLKFPLDLAGGVPRFRHRRGELEHVRFGASLERLGRFLDRKLRDVLGELVRPPQVWARRNALGIGLVTASSALAFDLIWAPELGSARFVVANARGVGLSAPPLTLALRALDSAVHGVGQRRGRVLEILEAGALLGRILMPAVGARVPSATRVRFGELEIDGDEARVQLDAAFPPPVLSHEAVRAFELSRLVTEADEALAVGELDAARAGYVSALEQAPRHPEIVSAIAEIDVCVGGRAEAALGLIIESMRATAAGVVAAELLARVGDADGCRQAMDEAARGEPFAPLAAMMWCRLAELEVSPVERMAALDRAVARSPALVTARWARFHARVERADVEGALADAQHLEAVHIGGRARHPVCMQAARALLKHGFVKDAGKLFERTLRYVPDDASATAGLARALREAGRSERAVSLLQRAIALSERKGRPDPDALIDLAVMLADELKDLPQAIARVRQVSAASERLIEARFLEAKWRSRIGDIVGAALAFGRMREAIELSGDKDPKFVEWLREAASFSSEGERDDVAAERHLAVALRLAPRDPRVADEYREAAARVAERVRRERD